MTTTTDEDGFDREAWYVERRNELLLRAGGIVALTILVQMAGLLLGAPWRSYTGMGMLYGQLFATVYAMAGLTSAVLVREGVLGREGIHPIHLLYLPANVAHELSHAVVAHLVGGSVADWGHDRGRLHVDVDVSTEISWLAVAAVSLAPTLVGVALWALLFDWVLAALDPTVPLLGAVIRIAAGAYLLVYSLPSMADLQGALQARDRQTISPIHAD